MSSYHAISATPETMVWGYLAATARPVIEVKSGDTVSLACMPAGGPASLPADRSMVPAAYLAAIEMLPQGPGAHFVTGPVFVSGAERGDTLQVEILSVEPTMESGFTATMPLLGTLPRSSWSARSSTRASTAPAESAPCPGGRNCRSTRSSACSAPRRRPNKGTPPPMSPAPLAVIWTIWS